jgi:hypothetical protein
MTKKIYDMLNRLGLLDRKFRTLLVFSIGFVVFGFLSNPDAPINFFLAATLSLPSLAVDLQSPVKEAD